jgi:MFS transporter, UMF1 family
MAKNRRAVVAWWLYDWANSAFVLTVVTAFFPVLFKSFWCANVDATVSTARLGIGNALAGLFVAILSPLLGAIADIGGSKKKLLLFFLLIGVVTTALLSIIPQSGWLVALLIFLIASICFNSGNIFYDALLIDVAKRKKMDWVSSAGYSIGYIGSGLLFLVNVIMINKPPAFGLHDTVYAVKAAFVIAAVWWMFFSLPLFLYVTEKKKNAPIRMGTVLLHSLRQITVTAAAIVKNKKMLCFLCAYWLYIDGVHTFILMAMDFGMSIGLKAPSLMIALIVVQFVGFPSTLLFGYLSKHFGAYIMIIVGIVIYLLTCIIGSLFLNSATEFMILAVCIACAQGGIQALSRSVFGKMVPTDEAAQYFGFFNIVNRFAVILGPAAVGSVAIIAKKAGLASMTASRLGMSSVSLLFIAGCILLIYTSKIKDAPVNDR